MSSAINQFNSTLGNFISFYFLNGYISIKFIFWLELNSEASTHLPEANSTEAQMNSTIGKFITLIIDDIINLFKLL